MFHERTRVDGEIGAGEAIAAAVEVEGVAEDEGVIPQS